MLITLQASLEQSLYGKYAECHFVHADFLRICCSLM